MVVFWFFGFWFFSFFCFFFVCLFVFYSTRVLTITKDRWDTSIILEVVAENSGCLTKLAKSKNSYQVSLTDFWSNEDSKSLSLSIFGFAGGNTWKNQFFGYYSWVTLGFENSLVIDPCSPKDSHCFPYCPFRVRLSDLHLQTANLQVGEPQELVVDHTEMWAALHCCWYPTDYCQRSGSSLKSFFLSFLIF